MARVLFMTSVYNYEDKGNLNVDLVDAFLARGHAVDVMTPVERKYGGSLSRWDQGDLRVLRFPCLNFRGKVNLIEKGLSTLVLGYQYAWLIRREFRDVEYDVAVYTTLPITYAPALRALKRRSGTFCYLLQKDFFPQSALDLGLLSKRSPMHHFFRWIEKMLFRASDMIGVMSDRNREYLLQHNPDVDASRVEVCPNSILPTVPSLVEAAKARRDAVRERYQIPLDRVVFLYGGNISRAQGVEFITSVVQRASECPGAYFLFVGSGQEFDTLREAASSSPENVQVISHLKKADFDEVLGACDVGMVFLDPRFTIANIPSRTLAHLDYSQPVIAATDEFTDFRGMIEGSRLGLWSSSKDPDAFLENVRTLTRDTEFRSAAGRNARQYLETQCDVGISYDVIMQHVEEHDQAPLSGHTSEGKPMSELERDGVR